MALYTIDKEAIKQLQSPFDIEKYGARYKTDNDYFTFPSPSLDTINKNLYYLLKNSTEKEFEQKYRYRPDYLSYDEYSTTILWQLLLYVNNVFSTEDFDLQTVIVPTLDAIIYILNDLHSIPEPQDLSSVDW